jgi:hypothetical protein
MLAGRLPSYLKETIQKYHDRWLRKFRLNDAYVEELRQRDYKGTYILKMCTYIYTCTLL